MITKTQLTFPIFTQDVTAVLKFQRNNALMLNSQNVAYLRNEKLHTAPVADGKVEMGKASGLDLAAWELLLAGLEQGPDMAEAIAGAIASPVFIELCPGNLHDFNVDEVRFEFEDMEIQDPTTSECGRFVVSPSYYGFDQLWDGTWSMALDDGTRIKVEGRVMSRFDCLGYVIAKVHLDNVIFDAEK